MAHGVNLYTKIYPHILSSDEVLPLQLSLPSSEKATTVFLYEYGVKISFKTLSGQSSRSREPTTIKANGKIPCMIPIYYFEVTVEDLGSGGLLALGVGQPNHSSSKLVGNDGGYGLTLDDGKKYSVNIKGVPYGPPCSRNDIVGCCVNFIAQKIFFTINGEPLGEAFQIKDYEELVPMVSMQSHGSVLAINFGDSPFKFKFQEYMQIQTDDFTDYVYRKSFILDDPTMDMEVLKAVFDYLSYNNMAESTIEFSNLIDLPLSRGTEELRKRKDMFDLIKRGELRKGFDAMNSQYPFIQKEFPRVYLLFSCLIFIQSIKNNNPKESLHYMDTDVDDCEELKKNLKMGKKIYSLYKELNMTDPNEINTSPDECGLTYSQWSVYLREVFCLLAYRNTVEFFDSRCNFDLTKNLLCGLSFALKSPSITKTLDAYWSESYSTFSSLSAKGDIMSSMALTIMNKQNKEL